MAVVNELISVEAFVKAQFPSSTYKQKAPLKPASDTFIVQLMGDNRSTETGYHTRVERMYQIVYVNSSLPEVLAKMDALSYAAMDGTLIPINASSRFIRVGAFSYSQPFETENDLYAVIGIMQTEIREVRTRDNAPLIGVVDAVLNVKIETGE